LDSLQAELGKREADDGEDQVEGVPNAQEEQQEVENALKRILSVYMSCERAMRREVKAKK